jgi:hypothetical protein
MIVAYIIFFVFGVVTFLLMAKFGLPIRLVAALTVFLMLSILFTVWVIRGGDKPPPDAVIVVPKHSESSRRADSED